MMKKRGYFVQCIHKYNPSKAFFQVFSHFKEKKANGPAPPRTAQSRKNASVQRPGTAICFDFGTQKVF